MGKIIRVAIDGPGGAGKSTVAKKLAKKLGVDYIDTGAMYRSVAYKISRENIDMDSDEELSEMLDNTEIEFTDGNVVLDGAVVNEEIRKPEISKIASACSALPKVRKKLVELQRDMGSRKSLVMDGRDIGTNVLKDAEFKFYLTASLEERARRRYDELIDRGIEATLKDVKDDIRERDYKDSTRRMNPLSKAEDAVEVDTTGLNVEEVTELVLKEIDNGND